DGRPDLVVGHEDGGPACFRNTGEGAAARGGEAGEDAGGSGRGGAAAGDGGTGSASSAGAAAAGARGSVARGGAPGTDAADAFEPMECPLPALLPNAVPRLVDLDGDGDLDVLAG